MSIILVIVCILILLYYITTRNYNYWKKKKVPYAKPLPLFGNYKEYITLEKHSAVVLKKLCEKFENELYFGTFFGPQPALVVLDPEIIKLIFTKDFYYFNSRELMEYTNNEVTTQNIFFNHNDKWKVFRQNLTPLFSSNKLKNMFYLIDNCTRKFETLLDHEYNLSDKIEVKSLMIKYTMDCICSCAFGVEANTMNLQSNTNPFTSIGNMIFGVSYYSGLKLIGRHMCPSIFYKLGFKYYPEEIDDFFYNLLIGVFESRNYKPSQRNDFVDLILSFKTNKYLEGDSITNLKTGGNKKVQVIVDNKLLVSQCVLFFAAGFETSASVLSATLYELAKNIDAQKRAQEEIDDYLKNNGNKLSFDCVKELPYIEACVNETMRLYPVLGTIGREVVEDYEFPTGLKVEKGLRIHLPVYYIHRYPNNFPEPNKYIPERFLPEAKTKIKPYTYFPFGEGPRTCIGMRFAKMQVYPGLVTFLKKYSVTLAEETPYQLNYTPTAFLLQPADDFNLKWTLRDGWEQRKYL